MREITVVGANSQEKVITIKPLNVKTSAALLKRVTSLLKRAETDKDLRMAINGLISMVDKDAKLNSATLMLTIPYLLENLFDELVLVIADLANLTQEDIEEQELATLIELIMAIVEVNDFEKIKGLLKNFGGLLKSKLPTPKANESK